MGNKLAKNLGVSGLWITKVHHLIKELVDDDKIVADTLLADLTKVLCECVWKERKRKRGKMKMGMVMRE